MLFLQQVVESGSRSKEGQNAGQLPAGRVIVVTRGKALMRQFEVLG